MAVEEVNGMAHQIVFRAEYFREGDLYVARAPELDVSSFGETLDEAKASLQEAVEAFLEECESMGSFEQVMEEAGFEKRDDQWLPRQPVAAELLTVR
ncbi:MAG: type II toxin-antitoxin system HicB family antitoxin [Candidatus Bipolaricaulota bacterium]